MGALARVHRENRRFQRHLSHEQHQQLRHNLRNMPLEHKQALIDALESEGMIQGAQSPHGSMAPLESPIGARAPYGLGSTTTTVPATGSVIGQTTAIVSPSIFQPKRLILNPRNLPAGITAYLLAVNIGTLNQVASLGASPFEAFDSLSFGSDIDFQEIGLGIPVFLQAQLFNSTNADIDFTWGGMFYGDRVG